MVDQNVIKDKFYRIVGFNQPFNPDFAILDADNTTSTSGLYIDENPYVKIEYIKDSQDYQGISDADFNLFLKRAQETAIYSVVNEVFSVRDYIDRQVLYPYAFNKTETDTLPDGWVGEEIKITSDKSVAFEITRVLLDFEGTGDITLFLMNTSRKTPLFTETITITTDHQEQELNWVVNDTNGIYKGEYYLGYLTQGLTVQPYNRDYERGEVMARISGLYIQTYASKGHATQDLFDLKSLSSLSKSTGVNPDITVYNDYTDLAVQNKRLFARAIQLAMQIHLIDVTLASLRSNRNQRISEAQIIRMEQELEGEQRDGLIKVDGLRPRLARTMKKLKSEVEKLKKGYGFGNEPKVITLT